jgi:GT2 family glycosyltransferase
MTIDVGIPMHGAAASVERALTFASRALDNIDAHYRFTIANDFSPPVEIDRIIAFASTLKAPVRFIHLADHVPGPNPNLAVAVSLLLDNVGTDADYYLNLESDVMLQPYTLGALMHGMAEHDLPWAFPMQLSPDGKSDFVFWAAGLIPQNKLPPILARPGRPKWCNLGCLLMEGWMARDRDVRPDPILKLWAVDTDYTSNLAQTYGRPLYWPDAKVTHEGRQSSKEGTGKYDYLLGPAVRYVDAKWAHYLPGGPF